MASGSCRPSHVRAAAVVNSPSTPWDVPRLKDIAQKRSAIRPICSHKCAPTLMKSLSPGVIPKDSRRSASEPEHCGNQHRYDGLMAGKARQPDQRGPDCTSELTTRENERTEMLWMKKQKKYGPFNPTSVDSFRSVAEGVVPHLRWGI